MKMIQESNILFKHTNLMSYKWLIYQMICLISYKCI